MTLHLTKKVCISETIKPNIGGETDTGVWDPNADKIIILRNQIQNVDKFAGTLIHEHKNLYDVDNQFEIELTNIIGALVGVIISKDILNNDKIYNKEKKNILIQK